MLKNDALIILLFFYKMDYIITKNNCRKEIPKDTEDLIEFDS